MLKKYADSTENFIGLLSHYAYLAIKMPRNVTVYISDELDEKMKLFGEVNWSEIARQGIETYIERRKVEVVEKNKVPDDVMKELRYYVNSLQHLMDSSYMYSILNMHNDFNIGTTPREKSQFFEIFRHLIEDYSELCRSLDLFESQRNTDGFQPIFTKLLRIFDRYSTMVRDFSSLVKEKASSVEPTSQRPRSRAPNEYLDETYANFREKYNAVIMSFVRFAFLTRELHQQQNIIDDHRVYQLLAPRLVDFWLSETKPAVKL